MFGSPAAATKVGNQSRPDMMLLSILPAGTLPGQRIIAGTRKPPSRAVPLPPANGVWPPSGQVKFSVPLSVEKTTMVLSSTPRSLSFCITAPTTSSSWAMPASSIDQPLVALRMPSYFGERCVTTCMRVGLSQTKKGLSALTAFSMKPRALSRMTSSTVSMSYLMPSIGCGGSGPSSVIFCLPTLPQRGSTVGSSTSVARVWRRLRGPTWSFRFCG